MRDTGGFGNHDEIQADAIVVSCANLPVRDARQRMRIALQQNGMHPSGIDHLKKFLISRARPEPFRKTAIRIFGVGQMGEPRHHPGRDGIFFSPRARNDPPAVGQSCISDVSENNVRSSAVITASRKTMAAYE